MAVKWDAQHTHAARAVSGKVQQPAARKSTEVQKSDLTKVRSL
jgi:hypothetical protein